MPLPHPYPRGWYRFRYSHEMRPGEVVTGRFFGKDLVGFRTASGRACVVDSHCTHLGAHLGDGRVEGETLECPFHGWCWDGDGRCTHVPFAERIPPRAALGAYEVIERNGIVYLWHDTTGGAPDFDVPVAPEVEDPGWMRVWVHRQVIRSHIQEPRENACDVAHTPVLHARSFPMYPGMTPEIKNWSEDAEARTLRFDICGYTGRPGSPPVENPSTFAFAGPGHATMRMERPLPLLFLFPLTPVDDEHLVFTMMVYTRRRSRLPLVDKLLGRLAAKRFTMALREDYTIFNRKVFYDEPVLSSADGPIHRLRNWMKPFYPPAEEDAAAGAGEGDTATGAADHAGRENGAAPRPVSPPSAARSRGRAATGDRSASRAMDGTGPS